MRNLFGRSFAHIFHKFQKPRKRRGTLNQIERLEDRSLLSGTSWATALGGAGDDIPVGIASTLDGGVIVVGNTLSFESANDIWINRFDSEGNLVWTHTYDHAILVALKSDPTQTAVLYDLDYAGSIEAKADGGFIVTGASVASAGGRRVAWVMTLNDVGAVTDDLGNTFNATSGFVASSEGVVTGNATLSMFADDERQFFGRYAPVVYIGDGNHGQYYGFVGTNTIAADITGGEVIIGEQGVLNIRTIVGNTSGQSMLFGTNERGFSIASSAGGGYGTASTSIPENANVPPSGLVRKLNSSFEPIWQISFNGTEAHSIVATDDGGFVVALATDYPSTSLQSSFSQSVTLVKLDPDGEIQWAKAYGGYGAEASLVVFPFGRTTIDLVATSDGYAFTTSTNSFGADDSITDSLDNWVVRTDLNGDVAHMTGLYRDVEPFLNIYRFAGGFEPGLFTGLDFTTVLEGVPSVNGDNYVKV
jgi:hypothetical protein